MIKRICVNLTNDVEQKLINIKQHNGHEVVQVSDFLTIEVWDNLPIDYSDPSTFGKDGARFIVMNNSEDICFAYYTEMASYKFFNDFGIDLENILYKQIRKQLGFDRKF